MNQPKDTFWWRLVNLDPAIYRAVITAFFMLAGGLGLHYATDLPDNFIAALAAILMLVQGVWTKGSVTPNAKVLVRVPDPVNDPSFVAAGPARTTAPNEEVLSAAKRVGK